MNINLIITIFAAIVAFIGIYLVIKSNKKTHAWLVNLKKFLSFLI